MKLWNIKNKSFEEGIIEPISTNDYFEINKSEQFDFEWIKEKKNIVFKLRKKGEENILGLLSLIDIPKESRLEIHLIEVSKNNIGKQKSIDRIAGCLIAYACDLAFQRGYDGFVSLVSKTKIIKIYKEKYGFQEFGNQLYIQLDRSQFLIKKYLENYGEE